MCNIPKPVKSVITPLSSILTCFLSESKNAAQQEKDDWMPAQKHASLSVPNQYPILKYEKKSLSNSNITKTMIYLFVLSNSMITNAIINELG